jgi:hypothetical protein
LANSQLSNKWESAEIFIPAGITRVTVRVAGFVFRN